MTPVLSPTRRSFSPEKGEQKHIHSRERGKASWGTLDWGGVNLDRPGPQRPSASWRKKKRKSLALRSCLDSIRKKTKVGLGRGGGGHPSKEQRIWRPFVGLDLAA